MAIDEVDKLDAIGFDENNSCIRLLLSDHLSWKDSKNCLGEYDHLMLLQNKINSYIAYLESKQYLEQYPNRDIRYAVIEVHFKFEISEKCQSFLQTVQDQLGQYGIKIEAHLSAS